MTMRSGVGGREDEAMSSRGGVVSEGRVELLDPRGLLAETVAMWFGYVARIDPEDCKSEVM